MKIIPTSKGIWLVSLPIILAGLSETIIQVTDAIFLSRFGVIELGAVALAETIYGMSVVFLLGLAEGIQVITARRAGQDRSGEIGKVFDQGLYLLFITSIGLVLAITFASPYLTSVIISSDNIRAAVDSFLKIIFVGVPFFAANFAYSALYISISQTRPLIYAMIILAITNVILDYCLIFGAFGFPRLGMQGAALASITAEVCAFLFFTFYTLKYIDIIKYGLFRFEKWNTPLSKLLLSISSPVALTMLLEALRWFLFFAIIEQRGEETLARANVIYSYYALLLIPVQGFSDTTCSMVSNLIGQQQASSIPLLIRRVMFLSYLVTAAFVAIALLLPEIVLQVFTSDSVMIDGCISGLQVVAVAILVVIPARLFATAILGTGDTVAACAIELVLTVCMLLAASGAALTFQLSLAAIWTSFLIGWLSSLALSYTWLKGGYWKRLYI